MAEAEATGLLVVDKPVGPTSHDVVQSVRKLSEVRKVGHTGTLDPLASGVLVLCLGKATRLSQYLTGSDKRYRATVHFGRSTSTYDGAGEVSRETGETPSREELMSALESFRGDIEQVPPPHSAIHVRGKRAYELARAGEPVELRARPVTIHELELVAYDPPELELDVSCSAGTYLRSLAHDLGNVVGTGAYLSGLRRTRVGAFPIELALRLDEVKQELRTGRWQRHLIPPANALPDLPAVTLAGEQLRRVRHGNLIPAEEGAAGLARGLDQEGRLIAILEAEDGGRSWHPTKVFVG